MAFTETPKEKEKRLAYYAKNKADAKAKEDKADAETARKFNETTNTDTSKNTNVMGDTYKKGGKVMKKYNGEDGSEVEFETAQGQKKSIGDETRAKAMAAMEKGSSDEPAVPKKTAVKLTPKAEAKPTPKEEPKTKTSSVQQAKDVISGKDVSTSTPKSFTASGGNTKASSKKEDLSGFSFGNVAKKLREKAGITSYKSGGSVSSASKRADGCAIRGKTRA